jgi:hypothetical protein
MTVAGLYEAGGTGVRAGVTDPSYSVWIDDTFVLA